MRFVCFTAGLAMLLLVGGCASLLPQGKTGDLEQQPISEAIVALQPSQEAIDFERVRHAAKINAVVLQIDGEKNRPKIVSLPNTGQTIYLSGFLKQTGADQIFSKAEIAVWRDSVEAPEGAKLSVRLKRGGRIDPLTDYAIRPGDRIVVSPAQSKSWFDGLF